MADESSGPPDAGGTAHEVIAMPGAATPPQASGPGRPATEGQWTALRNLARKQAGGNVPWINIADARALTDAGLASRSREGWDITPEGLAMLKAEDAKPAKGD